MELFLSLISGKEGLILQILSIVLSVSLAKKAIEEFAQKIVEIIPGTRDDEFLGKILNAKWYKTMSKILDWITSIKLPKKKPE